MAFRDNSSLTIASASSITLPPSGNRFVVTGSETVTSITRTDPRTFYQRITFVGGSSAAVTFTNTNSPDLGQMYLQGADVVLNEQDVLVLVPQPDGSWLIESTTAS